MKNSSCPRLKCPPSPPPHPFPYPSYPGRVNFSHNILQHVANRLHEKQKSWLGQKDNLPFCDGRVRANFSPYKHPAPSRVTSVKAIQSDMRERCFRLSECWLELGKGVTFRIIIHFWGNCPPTPPLSQY